METSLRLDKSSSAQTAYPGIKGTSLKMLVDKKRSLLIGSLAYLGFCMCLGLIFGLFGSQGGDSESVLYGMFSTLFGSLVAAMSFTDMRRTDDRLATLMQPATAAAKFWPRFILATVGVAVMIFIGYCALEAGRVLTILLMYSESSPFRWPDMIIYGDSHLLGWLIIANNVLFNQCLFFFGGILWPRVSLIKTMAVWVGFWTLLIIGFSIFYYILHKHGYTIVPTITEDQFTWIFSIVTLACSVLLVWLSYRRLVGSTILYGLRQR